MKRLPVSAGRITAVCLVLLVASAGRLVVGHAATLPVASERLTTHAAASQVAATTCTVAMAADSYVSKLNNASNFGTSDVLAVKSDTTSTDPRRSLVRADLSSCAIPSGAAVQSAQLALTIVTAPTVSRTFGVHRASSWTEGSVTWDTQPTVAAAATSSTSTGMTAGVTIRWDVKADVAAFVAGTASNDGWLVKDSAESDVDTGVHFASREHATSSARPSLVITYYP